MRPVRLSPVALLVAAALSCVTPSAADAPGAQPSFLFMLGDDIGWQDFRFANGTAVTPRISAWREAPGSVAMLDLHTGGTVCSPTRATILTGRNHFRDCVDYVYGCSDPTECTPSFQFAPRRTFTVADAVRAAGRGYTSHFGGKWHLGSFYNDSEALGGITSSPLTHGFDLFNATLEVAPTATTNCQCNASWQGSCDFGHNSPTEHCTGTQGPDPNAPPGCCFNYWSGSSTTAHGVANTTFPTPDDDATYNADSFVRFLESLSGTPFLAQVSFHNCHIPFVGTPARVAACNSSAECAPPLPGAAPYTHQELDFYACLNELDASVGVVLDALTRLGYYENTMTWFATDNGPEVNCPPEGRCGSGSTGVIPPGTLHRPACAGAGSAGVLRGRKRDVWEGGHRVPGVISWPAVVGASSRVSWDPVVTMDFHATILDVLQVQRPASQADWAYDGVSVLPILRGETPPPRSIGWMYMEPVPKPANGYGFRSGQWKLAVGGISCDDAHATFNCSLPQLYDMSTDWAEEHNLASTHPDILAAVEAEFGAWFASVRNSIVNESECAAAPYPVPFPPSPPAMSNCTFTPGSALSGGDIATGTVGSVDECCGACTVTPECVAADFMAASRAKPTYKGETTGGTCHLKAAYSPKPGTGKQIAARVPGRGGEEAGGAGGGASSPRR